MFITEKLTYVIWVRYKNSRTETSAKTNSKLFHNGTYRTSTRNGREAPKSIYAELREIILYVQAV